MNKVSVTLFIYLVSFKSYSCREEQRCSKYDFEEKVLEKVVRFEHKMEIMTESVNEISTKVNDDIHKMKTESATRGKEQTNAFNKLAENIQTEWYEIKKEFELMKNAVVKQEAKINETIKKEIDTLQKSFEDLSGILNKDETFVSDVRIISFCVC